MLFWMYINPLHHFFVNTHFLSIFGQIGKIFLFVRNISVDRFIENLMIQLGTVFETVTDCALPVIYGKRYAVESACCFTQVVHIILNIIRLYGYFFLYCFHGSGIGSGNGNCPFTGRKVTVAVIIKRWFRTDDTRFHQFGKKKFFSGLVGSGQFIITFSYTRNISLLKKRIYILIFQPGRNEIRLLCNFADCMKYFICDIALAQAATNFLRAIFAFCVLIL